MTRLELLQKAEDTVRSLLEGDTTAAEVDANRLLSSVFKDETTQAFGTIVATIIFPTVARRYKTNGYMTDAQEEDWEEVKVYSMHLFMARILDRVLDELQGILTTKRQCAAEEDEATPF